jgi:2-amino-4-hydroxy-6-hydroxymethyldihydropteridine diphosphokinase
MVRCYIALGSNLDNPLDQVSKAVCALAQLPTTQLTQTSPWYQTKAVGPGEQPDYINGVACLDTELSAIDLLHGLQQIEIDQQRVRSERWGPRTLDLDILLYGNQTIDESALIVPHPRMKERRFVLAPLSDIAPQLHLPDGSSLRTLLHYLPADDVCRLDA